MKNSIKSVLILAALFIVVYSCKKESDNGAPTGGGSGGGTSTATITGRVIDESNNAIVNASVVISGQTATTDQYGIFLLKNVSISQRCIASITKSGYYHRTHAFIAKPNEVSYIKVMLISNAQTHTISATAGGTATLPDGSSIVFSPNSFVNATTGSPYSGTVSLSVKHLSPDAPDFGLTIPGGDLLGKNSSNSDVALYTYGMIGAELKGSGGEQLQLATGNTATLTMSIASTQTGTAPSSIPLWYFDETTGLWIEQGSATRIGNNYVGTVSHFSWWNCDVPGPRANIIGKVLDCNSVPVPNVVVRVNSFYTLTTNSGGVYSNWVPAGIPLTIQVLATDNNNIIQNSQIENAPALATGQTFYVPDLIVPCPSRIAGVLKTCQGTGIDGFVSARWTGGTYYQLTQNDSFSILCPSSTAINIEAIANYNSLNYTFYNQYTSSSTGGVVNIGDILMCNQIASAPNDFTINGGPFVNQHFVIDTLSTNTYFQSGCLNFSMVGNPPVLDYNMQIPGLTAAVGTYTWGMSVPNYDISLYLQIGSVNYMIQNYSGIHIGTTTITYSGSSGGRVRGYFSGNALCWSASDSATVTVFGNFDVRHP